MRYSVQQPELVNEPSANSPSAKGVSRLGLLLLVVFAQVLAALVYGAPAFAQGCPEGSLYTSCAPGWEVSTQALPTNLAPGGLGIIEVAVYNVGAGSATSPITVTDELPEGLEAKDAGELDTTQNGLAHTEAGFGIWPSEPGSGRGLWACSGTRLVTCTAEPARGLPVAGAGAGAGYPMKIAIEVQVAAHPVSQSVVNRVTVAGGGAPAPASTTQPITLSSASPGFGFSKWDVWFGNADGTIDTQAGSHPYSATFAFDLNTALRSQQGEKGPGMIRAGGDVNSVIAELPPGLVGDPNAVPQCTRAQLNSNAPGVSTKTEECPLASQVGILETPLNGFYAVFPVYNMVPPAGAPAEFGFSLFSIPTFIISSVRTGGDYGISSLVNNIPQEKVRGSRLILWGFPSDPTHDAWRSEPQAGTRGCDGVFPETCQPEAVSGAPRKPFLTLPTSCSGPLSFSISASTWQDPSVRQGASVISHDSEDQPTGMTGCEHLGFAPALTLAPDTSYADTPAGLTAEVKPQTGGLSEVNGLSTSDIQNTKVVLPTGVVINPGQAAGLQACSRAQAALEALPDGQENDNAPECPSQSKVGTVSITTPLLGVPIEGNVYVLQSNPPELKLLVEGSAEGVNLKLVGTVHLNEATGQLTTTFEGTPELPFTDFKLSFSGGAQAALATPTHCGTYTSNADFNPWSSPFVSDTLIENSFAIASGTAGAPCPASVLPFSPSLIAGSTTDQAGGYTDFTMLLQTSDDQQRIEKLQFKVPSGLLGMISQVPLCPEPQAQQGTCPAASQIGHTVVASGPGPYPLVVPQPGQPPAAIYLTGPYQGAPFGLSIVVPVHVGPFVLPTQIVRAKIEVDPLTSQITVTTNPLPQIIAGVPTDLRTVNAVIDRPDFMFNPTNCNPMSFSGTAWGTPPPGTNGPGSTASISSHFQMGSCQALTFKPNLKVTTSGKTSRKQGASLDVKLVYPAGALGDNQASSQANIGQVKVDLPRQLPSRLTTLQKACTSQTFETNPAACPAESRVGTVTAITPVLPVDLTGPAIFVSYGGAKFPELVFVLQGYGITVYVHAETFISKTGITSSTLRHIPDVPIYSFELKLPQGPYSALAANGNLCKTKLAMPTAFTGQNGATLHQNTPITTTGCPKTKPEKKAKKTGGKRAGRAKPHRKKK